MLYYLRSLVNAYGYNPPTEIINQTEGIPAVESRTRFTGSFETVPSRLIESIQAL